MTTRRKKIIASTGRTAKRKAKVATIAAAAGKPKGRPKKEQITLRLDKDVIDHFRATGDGYLAKMDGFLTVAMEDARMRATSKVPSMPWYEENRNHEMIVNPVFRPKKEQITLRVDADAMAYFRNMGNGYQTQMNRVLRLMMLEMMQADQRMSRNK